MAEYISRGAMLKNLTADLEHHSGEGDPRTHLIMRRFIKYVEGFPTADVQEKRYCRMIPLEPDCRSYTDVFICTNCHQYIHLGFIRKEYSGSYCLECGAEVKDGDAGMTDSELQRLERCKKCSKSTEAEDFQGGTELYCPLHGYPCDMIIQCVYEGDTECQDTE